MKHFLRNIFIFLVDILCISFVYRFLIAKKPLVRVIAFHDVADVDWFEKVITMLSKNFTIITPDQFHKNEFDEKRINVLLTFDDGYLSWIDTCVPILEAHGAKGLFFINSGLLDIANDQEKTANYMTNRLYISPKKPLTWDGARRLLQAGHTIGGHTMSHPSLASLSIEEATKEVSDDKKRIEIQLGITLLDFAYPFGTKKHFSEPLVTDIQKLGYEKQYSAVTGFSAGGNAGATPRTLLEKNQNISSVRRWVEGGYDIFYFLNPLV